MLEIKVLRLFGPKRQNVTREFGNLHNEKDHHLTSVNKSKWKSLAGHVTQTDMI